MMEPSEKRRLGNKSLENVVRTNERYGHDGLWLGPRGCDYGELLERPKPYQIANLYPDQNSSYWMAGLQLPPGSSMILRGRYPFARYCQFALYRPEDEVGSFTATGEALVDHEIAPDEGSLNPFVPGAPRLGENRSYTLRVTAEEAPAAPTDRDPNTLYAGNQGLIQMVYRVYLPDVNRDGSGDVGLPSYEVELVNGTILSADEVRDQLSRPLNEIPSGMTIDQWKQLKSAPDNDPALKPETTPARKLAVVERYFSNEYNFVGVFKPPEVRAKMSPALATGFGGDPVTVYLFAWLSRKFGPVLVIRGRMPKFSDTFLGANGKGLETMTDWESRYWSVIMAEAPPSGRGNDALTDMQVPLDDDRNYTIVVSRAEDRPANATDEHHVAWLDWGTRGEGLGDASSRPDFGFLVFRFMYNHPDWKQSPVRITKPGAEAEVLGPYCPRFEYTDRATFEAKGPQP